MSGGDSHQLSIDRKTLVRPPRFDELPDQLRCEGFPSPVRIDRRQPTREGRFEVAYPLAANVSPMDFGTFSPASDAQDCGGILEGLPVRLRQLRPFAGVEGEQIGHGRQEARRERPVAAGPCRKGQDSQRFPMFSQYRMHECIRK